MHHLRTCAQALGRGNLLSAWCTLCAVVDQQCSLARKCACSRNHLEVVSSAPWAPASWSGRGACRHFRPGLSYMGYLRCQNAAGRSPCCWVAAQHPVSAVYLAQHCRCSKACLSHSPQACSSLSQAVVASDHCCLGDALSERCSAAEVLKYGQPFLPHQPSRLTVQRSQNEPLHHVRGS